MMLTWTELEHMSPLKKDYSKMIGNDRRKPLRMINSSVPVSSSQSCTNTDIKQLNARSQGWLGVVPSKAPWATLSWLQLLSLSTEKGQVPFGTSVGIVSFFTTLQTAGREGDKNKHHFQMQFSTTAAPSKGWEQGL